MLLCLLQTGKVLFMDALAILSQSVFSFLISLFFNLWSHFLLTEVTTYYKELKKKKKFIYSIRIKHGILIKKGNYLFVAISDKTWSHFFSGHISSFSIRFFLFVPGTSINQTITFVTQAGVFATIRKFNSKLLKF